ncbi:MAG: YdcF family protein, partial [Bifidobacteriaceae bacterium]|nr:YdcF family protein [Bifidobacteriaceae bacterium]
MSVSVRHAASTANPKGARRWRVAGIVGFWAVTALATALGGINGYVLGSAEGRILTADQASGRDYDCILVLGAGITPDKQPTTMLRARLDTGIELYRAGAAPVVLMSGDNSRAEYSEVAVMGAYAADKGVPAGDVYLDHAGFSTFDSVYRARDVFGARRVLIVTQRYHLLRALFIARQLGLTADGVAAAPRDDSYQYQRDIREVLARGKDAIALLTGAKPTFLGDPIPLVP